MPAPVAAPQDVDAVTRTAAPRPKRSIVPIVGGIAAVLVLGAGAWAFKNKGAAADTAKTHTDSVTPFAHTQDTTRGGASAAQQGNNGQPPVTPPTKTGGSTSSSPAAGNGAPAGGQNTAVDFDRLDEMADTIITANQALKTVNEMKAATDEERVRIALIRFSANLTKSAATTDQAKQEQLKNQGCAALKRVEQIAEYTTKKGLVASKLADICSY